MISIGLRAEGGGGGGNTSAVRGQASTKTPAGRNNGVLFKQLRAATQMKSGALQKLQMLTSL